MPLSLEQYAAYLDTRGLHWPAAPAPAPARARPHLIKLDGVRAVLWNVYGTLLSISGGEVWFSHPQPFVMRTALDKTVQEFKMWQAMTRQSAPPAEHLATIYEQVLLRQRMVAGGGNERLPEVSSERLWESVVKTLLQKDYRFDAGFYGSLNEFSRKIAYFFHRCLQGTACYPGTAETLVLIKERGLTQGLLGDAQPFTLLQLQRGAEAQRPDIRVEELLDEGLRFLSCDMRGRKPSDRIARKVQGQLRELRLEPDEILHVGNSMTRDVIFGRRLGFHTALFAGDRNSLQATAEQLKDKATRPDVLLTDLTQLADVIP
jgi:FMN phosphatase YigB (HAD superfamily)